MTPLANTIFALTFCSVLVLLTAWRFSLCIEFASAASGDKARSGGFWRDGRRSKFFRQRHEALVAFVVASAFVFSLSGCETAANSRAAVAKKLSDLDRHWVAVYNPMTGSVDLQLQITKASEPGKGKRAFSGEIDFKQPVSALKGITW